MSALGDVQNSLQVASRAWSEVRDAVEVYQNACMTYNWDDAEMARGIMIDAMEQYLDQFAAANRRIELEKKNVVR